MCVRLLTAYSASKKGSFTFIFDAAQSSHSGSRWQLSLCHQDFRYPCHARCSLTVRCDLIAEHAVLPTCHVTIFQSGNEALTIGRALHIVLQFCSLSNGYCNRLQFTHKVYQILINPLHNFVPMYNQVLKYSWIYVSLLTH